MKYTAILCIGFSIAFHVASAADPVRTIPITPNALFGPDNFSIDSSGKIHPDDSIWSMHPISAGQRALYVGKPGSTMEGNRIEVQWGGYRSLRSLTYVLASKDMRPAGESSLAQAFALALESMQMNSPTGVASFRSPKNYLEGSYINVMDFSDGNNLRSQTQCMGGKACITVTGKACSLLLKVAQAKSFRDLIRARSACSMLDKAWSQFAASSEVQEELKTAHERNLKSLRDGKAIHQLDKNNPEAYVFNPKDRTRDEEIRGEMEQLYLQTCGNFHSENLHGGGEGEAAPIKQNDAG